MSGVDEIRSLPVRERWKRRSGGALLREGAVGDLLQAVRRGHAPAGGSPLSISCWRSEGYSKPTVELRAELALAMQPQRLGAHATSGCVASHVSRVVGVQLGVGGPESRSVDAAHIIPEGQLDGDPVVPSGLMLCKIHHAAYDANLLGVRPDLVVEVQPRLLEEINGPMLAHGLKAMAGVRLHIPRTRAARRAPAGGPLRPVPHSERKPERDHSLSAPMRYSACVRVGGPRCTRRPRRCSGRSWRWRGDQAGERRYALRPSQRTLTPSSSATRNSGSPVRTGQSSTDAAPAAKASA